MNLDDAPSLEKLNEFVDHIDLEEKATVEHFYNDAQKNGYYWLYGQLKMLSTEPLTYDKIEKAIEINAQCMRDYDGPCNAMEMHSIADHKKKFRLLQTAIEKYYQFQYAPPDKSNPLGGKIYQYLAKITTIGK